jgi:hypothetical protein
MLGPPFDKLLYIMTCQVWYAEYTSPNATSDPMGETIMTQDEFGVPYYANVMQEAGQNIYGEAEKVYRYDRNAEFAYFNVMGTVNLQDLSADREFEYKKRLNGRFKYNSDPRKGSDGIYHPVSDILITNIRSGGQQLHTNHRGDPIIFEVMSVDPFIDPFGKIEYYKLLLERADDQELIVP